MLRPIFEGVLNLEISKCQIFNYILHEIMLNTIIKQHLMLFKFMFRVSLAKMCYCKWVKCRIWVCDNMYLDTKKRGWYIWREYGKFNLTNGWLSDTELYQRWSWLLLATIWSDIRTIGQAPVFRVGLRLLPWYMYFPAKLHPSDGKEKIIALLASEMYFVNVVGKRWTTRGQAWTKKPHYRNIFHIPFVKAVRQTK